MDWAEFTLAFLLFFLSHSIPVRPSVRSKLLAQLGASGFSISYSLLSLAVLYWLILATSRAPHVELWEWQLWQNQVPIITMLVAFWIVAMSIGRPNPFSFGGAKNETFDPAKSGLVKWVRHPLLISILIWSLAHIIPNGDLAHILLFGTFACFSLLGMWMIDRRKRVEMGLSQWSNLQQKARSQGELFPDMSPIEIAVRTVGGLTAYLALLFSHSFLFGVSPVI